MMSIRVQARAKPTSFDAVRMSGVLQRKCACGTHTLAGGECASCEKEKSSRQLQRAAVNAAHVNEVPPIVHDVLRSPGQPLDAHTRSFFEPRFAHDFSRVRVHTDAQAAESARSVNALAYTVGSDIVFGTGEYAPHTIAGQRLLAHELTHTLQQAASVAALMPASIQVNAPDDAHEREADLVAAAVVSGDHLESTKPITSAAPSIQRSLRVDDLPTPAKTPGESPFTIFQDALAKATERIVTYQGDDLIMENWQGQKPKTIESFIRRAINSSRVYRLRLGSVDLTGRPVRGASWETQGAEVVITVNPAHTGESTWTVGELVVQQIASAVTQNDPEEIPSRSEYSGTMEKMMSIPSLDYLLTARLPYGSTDSTAPDDIKKLQKKTRIEVEHYLGSTQAQRKLTHQQQSRAIVMAQRADGITLLQLLQGIESNQPYRLVERRQGDRVFVTYDYPDRKFSDTARGETTRRTTFIPGQDATAPEILPGVSGPCNNQQKSVDANSCCTPDMMKEIRTHLATARTHTQRAVARLENETGTECYLKRHFGADGTPANKREITTRLKIALQELHLSRHEWKCRDVGSGLLGCVKRNQMVEGKRVKAIVRGVTPPGEVAVVMCVDPPPNFIDWVSVLHEVVHRSGIGGMETYHAAKEYPGAKALLNADSYAHLAEDLGGPNWTRCETK